MKSPSCFASSIAIVLLCSGGLGSPALHAQVKPPAISVFPAAPRALRQNLVRAKKAIEEERFSDAVAELGIVLTEQSVEVPAGASDENQDFFIEAPGSRGAQTSLKAEAQRLLGTLPPKGRELFELQFGADARALLDTAVQNSDVNQLNEVVRRYFHTKAGYEATLLLGRLHLDHGRPLAAALCLQRIAQVQSAARQFEPELSILLAACWQLARQPAQAQKTLADLPGRLTRGQVQLGDSQITELPGAQQSVAWLTEQFRAVSLDDAESGQWPLFRGNPARTATRSGGLPLKKSRWQVPLMVDDHDRSLVEELRTGFVDQGLPMLPVVQPLAVGNVILLRSSERLIGIDFQTGKRIWEYPWWDLSQEEAAQPVNPLVPQQNTRELRINTLRARLWQDVPFGQVSSDGNSVYLLDGQRESPRMSQQLRWQRGRGIGFPMETSVASNELVALDLQREGYMLWKVGGETGGEEPKLAGVLFLGPPLPLFGQLYLVAEIKGELRLVVLDATSGKQQWSQQLAHVEATWGVDEQLRRNSGATPSFADGVLICPTSAGAVVAVDVATRTLLWGYQYSSQRDTRNGFMQPFQMQQTVSPNRWQDASATIAEGSVLITPVEADTLVCLDLLTGTPRWPPIQRKQEMADMLYIAGVFDGAAILVGKSQVAALRLKDGKFAWKEPVRLRQAAGEMPSGRGFLSDRFFYLPTTASELVKMDLQDGRIVERVATDHVLGNLVCFRDEILSVAADRASTFFQIEPLRKKVETRLAQSPDDAWALARFGELLVHDGKTGEALVTLRKAHDRDPSDEGVRSLLIETFLTALRDDFDKHSELASVIEPLLDSDKQRTQYLMLLAAGWQRAGKVERAVESLEKLVRVTAAAAKKAGAAEAFPMVSPDVHSQVRADRYLSGRLAELYTTGESPVRDRIDTLVRDLGSQVQPSSLQEMRHYLQLCGFHPATNAPRLQLATKLIGLGELLEAEITLTPLLDSADRVSAGQAWALAAKLYEAAKKPRLFADAYQRLGSEWGDVAVSDGKTGKQLFEQVAATLPLRVPLEEEWPWGITRIEETRDPTRQSIYPFQPCFSILERRGSALAGLKLVFDFGRTTTYLRDGNGAVVYRLPHIETRFQMEPGLWRTASDRHLFFSVMSGHVTAVDTLRPRTNENEAVLWRETLFGADNESMKVLQKEHRNPFDPSQLVANRWGDSASRPIATVGPMTASGVCVQKIRAVTCLDPLTGNTIWSRSDFEQGCELFGDHEWLFVMTPAASAMKRNTPAPADDAGKVRSDQMTGEVECSILSVRDGQTLGKRRLPAPGNRWTTRGRNVLAWEQHESKFRLYLYDAEREKDLWSETFSEGSRGFLIDNEAVAVLQPDGRFVMRSLVVPASADVSDRTETQIEPTPGLASIHVLASSSRLLLVVNDSQAAPGEGEVWRRSNRQNPLPVNGRIFSIDRATGKSLWQVPAVVRGFALLPEQPDELPTLWLVRTPQAAPNQFGASANTRLDVLCLDRRTGAALLSMTDVASSISSFDISSDLRKKEATLVLPQVQYTVRFTSEPRAPAPPFQQPRDGNRVDSALERLGNFMESVKEVLAPPKPNPFK